MATVGEDFSTIRGEVRTSELGALDLEAVLSRLPLPTEDRAARRTFWGAPEAGLLHLESAGTDRWAFHTVLPRRLDAAGVVPRRGLYTNGWWHPQPMGEEGPALVSWQVTLRLPEGAVGVLNGTVGSGELLWEGQADHLALAVIPDAHVSELPLPAGRVQVVERGRPDGRRAAHLEQLLTEGWPGPQPPRLVVVETPARRRLAQAGPETLFLSDRAFRLSGRLARYHSRAVRRGLMEAGLPIADPWARTIAAGAIVDSGPPEPELEELLGFWSWIPEVDALLYDGTLPFYSDVFDETWAHPEQRDAFAEVLDPRMPGRVISRRVGALQGPEGQRRLAALLQEGRSPAEAAQQLGLGPQEYAAWLSLPPEEQIFVEELPHGELLVVRQAPDGSPPLPLTLEIDGQPRTWPAPSGTSSTPLELPRGAELRLDPQGLSRDVDRSDNAWPVDWTTTAAFFPSNITLSPFDLTATADLAFRRRHGSRNVYDLALSTSPEDLVGLDLGVYHSAGPLQDRRSRPFRFWVGGGPALLDPAFRPVAPGTIALGAYSGAAWETRTDAEFPRHGHRLALSISGGGVPATGETWSATSVYAMGLLPLGGRLVLAARAKGALAESDVEHRLTGLGGAGDVSGLTSEAALGNAKVSGGAELRAQVLRGASIPLPLVWVADMQVSAGLEAGQLWRWQAPAGPAWALGWTSALSWTGDVFGARPSMLAFGLAGPLAAEPIALAEEGPALIPTLRFFQSF